MTSIFCIALGAVCALSALVMNKPEPLGAAYFFAMLAWMLKEGS